MPDSNSTAEPVGLLLSDDFLFTSRITGTARHLGLMVKSARNSAALIELAQQHSVRCILVDLSNPGLDIAALVRALRPNVGPVHYLVAYGSHVDAATLKAARDAGCDLVLPRSKFVEELPNKMREWFGESQRRMKNGE